MRTYLRAVSTLCGLCAVLSMGFIIGFFVPADKAGFGLLLNPLLWIFVYIFLALVMGEFLMKKTLRKKLWCVCLEILLDISWFITFFYIKYTLVSLFICSLLLADLLFMLFLLIKNSKLNALLIVPVFAWYLYLFGVNLLTIII